MLPFDTFKVFDARDVFDAVQKRFGEDVEGSFNEIHYPPDEGAIYFWIPDNNEEWDSREICEKYVADILMREGGLTWGDTCLIYFDY